MRVGLAIVMRGRGLVCRFNGFYRIIIKMCLVLFVVMPGFNCTDVDECKSPQSCQYGQCHNTQGSYECRCPPNYELVSDGTACFGVYCTLLFRDSWKYLSEHLFCFRL